MQRKLIEVHMHHGEQLNDSMTACGIHEFSAMCHILATRIMFEKFFDRDTHDIYTYRSEMNRTLEMQTILKSILSAWNIYCSPPHPYLNPAKKLFDLPEKISDCPKYGEGIIPFWKKLDLGDTVTTDTESWVDIVDRTLKVMNNIAEGKRGMHESLPDDLSIFLYHGGVIEPMLDFRFDFQLTDLPSATMILVYEEMVVGGSHSYELLSPYGNQDWAARKEEGEYEID